MRVAVLIQCHKNVKQIRALIESFQHPNVHVFVHIDSKSELDESMLYMDRVTIIEPENRHDVRWGEFSQLQATETLLRTALQEGPFNYYWLVSGQDILLEPIDYIVDYLDKSYSEKTNYIHFSKSENYLLGKPNNLDKRNAIYYPNFVMGRSFIKRLVKYLLVIVTGGYNKTFSCFKRAGGLKYYYGSSWWCLTDEVIDWIISHIDIYNQKYQNSICPDESLYQTAFMDSPYKKNYEDMFLYVDWSEGKNSPKNLTINDCTKMSTSGLLIARKVDNINDYKDITDWIKNARQNKRVENKKA